MSLTTRFYCAGAGLCFLLSALVFASESRALAVVSGAANCQDKCYNDTFVVYECTHKYHPNSTGPPFSDPTTGAPLPCDPLPAVPTSTPGCIKNTMWISFCETASSGGDCDFEVQNTHYVKQWANLNTSCTSTNSTGVWNYRATDSVCKYFHPFCTSFETSGCTNPTTEGLLQVVPMYVCKHPENPRPPIPGPPTP